ncbi:hypothetical protein [Kitasatospora sp. NPDC057015]|uniref:hypothetical protein n=1 Tax=Kitasatospora sp. NPDC057015 TaxID=3346001 RepID=UPI00363D8E9C
MLGELSQNRVGEGHRSHPGLTLRLLDLESAGLGFGLGTTGDGPARCPSPGRCHAAEERRTTEPDCPDEDFTVAGPNAVVLLDGAGTPAGSACGCVHRVAWYVSRLGVSLLAAVTNQPDRALTDCLADAITLTAELHADTCDLTHPGTPSATVVAVRLADEVVEYLVLADSTLVLEHADERGPVAVTDDREALVGAALRGAMDAESAGTAEHADALRGYVEGTVPTCHG